jgi:hypothetical protein
MHSEQTPTISHVAQLEQVPLERVEVGRIAVPSGRVVVADPFFPDGPPFEVGVPFGPCRVTLVVAHHPEWGRRVAHARLELAPVPIARWRASGQRLAVESGMAAFMDVGARDTFRVAFETYEAAHPAGYYDEVLQRSLSASATVERPGGDWGLHRLSGGHSLAVFSSGLGDGVYDVQIGQDTDGRPVALAIDFEILGT